MAIATGKTQVMLSPHSHEVCRNCTVKELCPDRASIIVPIKLYGEVLGIIGIFAQTIRLEERLRNNAGSYTAFTEQMAELIVADVRQQLAINNNETLIELLEVVFKSVDVGIVIVDAGGIPQKINREGKRILRNVFPEFHNERLEITENAKNEPDGSEERKTCMVKWQDTSCVLPGRLYSLDTKERHKVFLFTDRKYLERSAEHGSYFRRITGTSERIRQIRTQIEKAASSRSGVLIQAEPGLEKEIYAKAIHDESERWDKPFIQIECQDIPVASGEEYFFGTATRHGEGGMRGKNGILDTAAGGTLYLENIDKLSLPLQRKLTAVMEKKEFRRVGSSRGRHIDLRVIASSGQDLLESCSEGRFSTDLYYMLSVFTIHVPSLRERKEDLRMLTMQIIRNASYEQGLRVSEIDPVFWKYIETYSWPGNMRELRNAVEHAANMIDSRERLEAWMLPSNITGETNAPDQEVIQNYDLNIMEKHYIEQAVIYGKKNKMTNSDIAAMLGISKRTFYRKIEQYHIEY